MNTKSTARQIEVLLPTAIDHGFDYLSPEGAALAAGDIVSVPLGRGQSLGVVWGEGKAQLPPGKIKPVSRHQNEFPALSAAMRQFIDWVAWYTCAPKGAVLKMVLPIDDIAKEGRTSTRAHIQTDIDVNAISLAPLSGAQGQAAGSLRNAIGKGFSVQLLDGVTGSGKTEVYFEAIAAILKSDPRPAGRGSLQPGSMECAAAHSGSTQVLILLPEIALSIQWLQRFEARFGFAPVLWNSEITPARKRAGWQAISKGEARVVVGARSALFLPYRNLSLIIANEEHDGSYKQEEGVIYHARDMAVARARFEKIPVVLVSATPSLESHFNAKQGKYHEITLKARHNDAQMPSVTLIDMRSAELERGAFVSRPLREQLATALSDGHQSLLFLNRRGYAPLLLCRACGHRFQCPDCSAWMVVHKKGIREEGLGIGGNDLFTNPQSPMPNAYLQCHHCSYRVPFPRACPTCTAEDKLAACGPGVERLHDEITALFPQARVAVMASDSMGGVRDVGETITAMMDKRIDILIGTQMIAKGHHFAGLAVVGVVDADLGLAGGDLRASERTYQMLHQLSGRAGRDKVAGRVYLQSFLPEHPVIKALVKGERDAFLAAELSARRKAQMPPFTRLAALIVEGEKEEHVMAAAKNLASSFPMPHDPRLMTLYGPAPAPLFLLRGKFRFRLLVKAQRNVNLPECVKRWVEAQSPHSSVRIKTDIDPQSFL